MIDLDANRTRSVVGHVTRGVDARMRPMLKGWPSPNVGRWMVKLIRAAAALDGDVAGSREEAWLDMADAWTDIAAIAQAAAVSAALVAFEDQDERVENAIYKRLLPEIPF